MENPHGLCTSTKGPHGEYMFRAHERLRIGVWKAPARRRSLLLRELGDETLAYDLSSHRASCLNREAAAVFHACDGRRSPQEIAAVVSATARV